MSLWRWRMAIALIISEMFPKVLLLQARAAGRARCQYKDIMAKRKERRKAAVHRGNAAPDATRRNEERHHCQTAKAHT